MRNNSLFDLTKLEYAILTIIMKRIAIILEQNLEKGQIGNVAAILMGQASLLNPEIYDSEVLNDKAGNRHAAITYSTVILKGGQGKLINFAQTTKQLYPEITCILFSRVGQGLHNAFPEYRAQIMSKATEELQPVGVIVVGEDEKIREITKKFSLL